MEEEVHKEYYKNSDDENDQSSPDFRPYSIRFTFEKGISIDIISCHQSIWRIHFWSPTYWWTWGFRFDDERRYINDDNTIHHYIIKQEVDGMSSESVKRLAVGTIKLLWRNGDHVDQLLDDVMQQDIDTDILKQKHDIQQIDKGASLYYDIFCLKEWKWEKQKWYTSEYIKLIRCLQRKYPDNHQTIIKTLQILNSTLYKLMKI